MFFVPGGPRVVYRSSWPEIQVVSKVVHMPWYIDGDGCIEQCMGLENLVVVWKGRDTRTTSTFPYSPTVCVQYRYKYTSVEVEFAVTRRDLIQMWCSHSTISTSLLLTPLPPPPQSCHSATLLIRLLESRCQQPWRITQS